MRECKLVQPLWRIVWRSLIKLKMELPSVQFSSVTQSCPTLCDPKNHRTTIWPSSSTLGVYSEKTLVKKKDTCTPMFIAALFTVVRLWRQSKGPWTDERVKKMCYIYTMDCFSAINKNVIMPFAATWMDIEIIILSEVNQRKTSVI